MDCADAQDRAKVLQALAPGLPERVGGVIIDYFVRCMPTFEGRLDDLYQVVKVILDGVLDGPELHELCRSLLQAFGKDRLDFVDEDEKFSTPVSVRDLVVSDYQKKVKSSVDYIPSQYLFGKAEENRRRGGSVSKDARRRELTVLSPSNFFFDSSKKNYVSVRDFRVEPIDISVASHTLIQDTSLNVVYGRRYGLVGRNGSGKSTLFRAMALGDLKIPKELTILHVEQEIIGDETSVIQSLLKSDQLRERLLHQANVIQMQMDRSADLDAKALESLDGELQLVYTRLGEINADEAPVKASRLLSGLGFSVEMQQQPTRIFSGGWRMRIALARALFCEPDLLLLDEPTNMLDLKSVIWLEKYLTHWKKTLIAISHDRSFLGNVTTDIIHLTNKKLKQYPCSYENFLEARAQELKHQASAKHSQEVQRLHIQKFIDKFRYNSKRASLVQSRIKLLKKMDPLPELIQDSSIAFSFPPCEPIASPIIQLHDVGFEYKPGVSILENVNLSIDQDSQIGIVGSNGAGKTTLVNLIYGDSSPTNGSIYKNARLKQAFFSQHHVDSLDVELNSIEFLKNIFPGKDFHFYISSLAKYGIDINLAKQKIETLSGGQKSRVVFACMALQQPHFMILDEPVNHLDLETVDALIHALNNYNGAYVIISHDERLITHCCDEMWVVENKTLTRWNKEYSDYREMVLNSIEF